MTEAGEQLLMRLPKAITQYMTFGELKECELTVNYDVGYHLRQLGKPPVRARPSSTLSLFHPPRLLFCAPLLDSPICRRMRRRRP